MNEEIRPLVSVITVVYNGEAYLEKTIQSVLDQTYPRVEYIVVDGASTDKSLDIIQKYEGKIKLTSEKDQGIYDAMNKGMSMATGEWINFLNGGDTYYNSTVLSEIFEKQSLGGVEFIYGDSINVYRGSSRYFRPADLTRASLRKYLGLCHQAVFARRGICPFYDLDYRYKAEYNWVIDIVYSIPQKSILHLAVPFVNYELGGFSEKGMIKNLGEFMQLTRKRFGWKQVILNVPMYCIVFLRFIKYSLVRTKWF